MFKCSYTRLGNSDFGLRQNIIQTKRGDKYAFLNTALVVQTSLGLVLWYSR